MTVTGTVGAGDPGDTVSVSVNGDPAPVAADGTFSAIVSLAPGTNTIHIVATDGYGFQVTAHLTVVRS